MSKKKNLPVIIGGIAAGVVIIALSVAVIHLVRQKGEDEQQASSESERRNVVITESNVTDIVESIVNEPFVPPTYYTATMNTTWHFETGDGISRDAYVENDRDNSTDIYFDLFLEEDEDNPILQSPVIPRGARLDGIALDQPLEAGEHACVLIYHLIDGEQNTLGTVRVAVTIIVER